MVNQTLEEAYNKLKERKRKYDNAARLSNTLSNLGLMLFYLSFIIPVMLSIFLGDRFSRSYPQIGIFGGGGLAIVLLIVSTKLKKNIPSRLYIHPNEIEFLEVFEALKELELLLKNEVEFENSKSDVAKLLSKIEKDLISPSKSASKSAYLRRALTKEIYDKLNLLRQNLNGKIIPIIKNGEIDDVKKTYLVVEDLAQYFLKPSLFKLESLNTLINELPSINIEKKEPSVQLFERYPSSQHIAVFLFFIFLGYTIYYFGINYVNVSRDNAFIAAVALIGTLSAGYIGRMKGGKISK